MREFIVRLFYALFLLVIYYIGSKISPFLKEAINRDVDLELILPLTSIVFLDYWIRALSHFFFRLDLRHKIIGKSSIKLGFKFSYYGRRSLRFNMGPIQNLRSINPVLLWDDPITGDQKEYPVPEKFKIDIAENLPVIEFTMICNFKKKPEPILSLFRYAIYCYRPIINFKFGEKPKSKSYLLFKFEKER